MTRKKNRAAPPTTVAAPERKSQPRDPMRVRVEAAMDNPKQRLALAEELYGKAQSPELATQAKLDLLQYAVRLDPFATRYRRALAQCELDAGLVDAAIAEYRRGLTYAPLSAPFNVGLGEALLAAGRHSEARSCFLAALGPLPAAVKDQAPVRSRRQRCPTGRTCH